MPLFQKDIVFRPKKKKITGFIFRSIYQVIERHLESKNYFHFVKCGNSLYIHRKKNHCKFANLLGTAFSALLLLCVEISLWLLRIWKLINRLALRDCFYFQ